MESRAPFAGRWGKDDLSSDPTTKDNSHDSLEDSVASIDCGLPKGLEGALLRLTEAVKDLQHAEKSESTNVDDLLTRAQSEINKLSSRCEAEPIDPPTPRFLDSDDERLSDQTLDETKYVCKTIDDDEAFLQSIPLQKLLGACFQQHSIRHLGQRTSSSTVSTFQDVSSKDSIPSSSSYSKCSREAQRSLAIKALPDDVHTMRAPLDNPFLLDSRSSIASVCPSLPCSGDDEVSEASEQRLQDISKRRNLAPKQLLSPLCASRDISTGALGKAEDYIVDGKVSLPSFEFLQSGLGLANLGRSQRRQGTSTALQEDCPDKLSASWPDHRKKDLDVTKGENFETTSSASWPKQDAPKVNGLLATACIPTASPLLGTCALQPYRRSH